MACTQQTLLLFFASLLLANVSRVLSQWTNKHADPNHVLKNHVIKSKKIDHAVDCLQECEGDAACYSINFYSSGVCELNDKTKEKMPKDFQPDTTGFYMGIRQIRDGLSNSTAASSCAELKRTHPESCSRSYWLDTNNDGNPTEQMCFMNSAQGVVSSCNTTTFSGKCCAFPFVYSGVTYNSCTDIASIPANRQWCSLTAVYSSSSWDYCVIQCPTCSTEYSHCCVFPFEYDGKTFESCTTYGSATGKPWCSRTREYENSWDYCGGPECEYPNVDQFRQRILRYQNEWGNWYRAGSAKALGGTNSLSKLDVQDETTGLERPGNNSVSVYTDVIKMAATQREIGAGTRTRHFRKLLLMIIMINILIYHFLI